MVGFLICEARAEATLFLVTVDSQKAFDVVDHIIMLDTYYERIQNHPLWTVVKNLDLFQKLNGKAIQATAFKFIKESDREILFHLSYINYMLTTC